MVSHYRGFIEFYAQAPLECLFGFRDAEFDLWDFWVFSLPRRGERERVGKMEREGRDKEEGQRRQEEGRKKGEEGSSSSGRTGTSWDICDSINYFSFPQYTVKHYICV